MIRMVFTTEGSFEVAVENWHEWVYIYVYICIIYVIYILYYIHVSYFLQFFIQKMLVIVRN